MSRERIVSGIAQNQDEDQVNINLRPNLLDEYIGQKDVVNKLLISLQAAKQRQEPLEHVLLYGPPGLGKTTLAHIIANEMKAKIIITSGPSLERTGDLMGLLTNMEKGDVLFIDEIHRLPRIVEEFLYPAMEDYKVDFIVDRGAFAKTINVPLKQFTLVGATTRAGLLSAPLRERFGLFYHLDFYPENEIQQIIKRSSQLLNVQINDESSEEISKRVRGTPRIANRILRRVRDYAQVKSDGIINLDIVKKALKMEGIDTLGLDDLDRKFLKVIIEHYDGGPVGIEAIGATLNEEIDTLVDMVEPYLLKTGFLKRTRSGRKASISAYKHLGITNPTPVEEIFEG